MASSVNEDHIGKPIALVFDFDDTVTDDSVSQLLRSESFGLSRTDVKAFWREVNKLVEKGHWDPALAYMTRLAEEAKTRNCVDALTSKRLQTFGEGLRLYDGLPEMLEELTEYVRIGHSPDSPMEIKYFVITGGLESIVRGSKMMDYLENCWGSAFYVNLKTNPVIVIPKTTISFTEKTRYLFQINKGLIDDTYRGQPTEVNKPMDSQSRQYPFERIIYVGDGLTDIPCMSVLELFKGRTFGVFDRAKLNEPEYEERSWLLLVREVPTLQANYSSGYRANDPLGRRIRHAVCHICDHIVYRNSSWLF